MRILLLIVLILDVLFGGRRRRRRRHRFDASMPLTPIHPPVHHVHMGGIPRGFSAPRSAGSGRIRTGGGGMTRGGGGGRHR